MERTEWLKRLLAFVGAAVVIIGLAAVAPLVVSEEPSLAPPAAHPEYSPENVAPERIEAAGDVPSSGQVDGGTVLIDTAHRNRFTREDIGPLVEALVRAGYDVERLRSTDDLDESLQSADALLVIDPGMEYSRDEVESVEGFIEDGGRLVVMGEPNRKRIAVNIFGASITTQRTRFTTLGSALGISFDTRYLYDMESNDGNFQQIVVGPAEGATVEGVERAAMYTATEVTTRSGEPVLVTETSASKPGVDGNGRFTVAAVDGNVLAIGDKTMFADDRYNVADNEAFVAYVVAFLSGGEGSEGEGEPKRTATPTPTPSGANGTTTPSAIPTPAASGY